MARTRRRRTRRKTKKQRARGGTIRPIARPLGKAAMTLGENVGKDYLQNKLPKVVKGIQEDASLAKQPSFLLSATKPMPKPKSHFQWKLQMDNPAFVLDENKENMTPLRRGGKRKRTKRT